MTTAYCYDPFNLRHHRDGHPENHGRLANTWALLQADGILHSLLAVPSAAASDEQLLRVHGPRHLAAVAQAAARCEHLDPDTYTVVDSEQAARLAAGGLMAVQAAVLRGEASNGFALVRPPGHHATPQHAMGFCLYNHVALAARAAQAEHGVQRVLIVDFDVHHGNGTQDAFYSDDSVLFFSTHQYPYYPGTGGLHDSGSGSGRGSTVNVPLPAGAGDAAYAAAFDTILAPLAQRFRPELVLVSAGYDAHWDDPLASMRLSISGYAALVTRLLALADALCQGRIVFTLEGGYQLEVLAHALLTTLRQLNGQPNPLSDPLGASPRPERDVAEVLARVRQVQGVG
ncbi:MAG: histone deacetylase [Caldilineales bacterium]